MLCCIACRSAFLHTAWCVAVQVATGHVHWQILFWSACGLRLRGKQFWWPIQAWASSAKHYVITAMWVMHGCKEILLEDGLWSLDPVTLWVQTLLWSRLWRWDAADCMPALQWKKANCISLSLYSVTVSHTNRTVQFKTLIWWSETKPRDSSCRVF